MKEQKLTVTENRALTESVYRMELAGEALEAQKPGQFVNIRLDGLFLQLRAQGRAVSVVLGFNTWAEVFGEEEFKALGCDVTVTTADGSYGKRGFVTDALPEEYSFFYTCGPEPMLRAVYRATKTGGQFSFEERMGCGFGACMGCSCKTITGYKRICREGPVLEKEEILWAD